VNALRVDAIGDSGQEYGGRAFRDCLAAARARHVPVILVRKGMRYTTSDGVAFDALAPEEPLFAEGANDVNENSVVLRLSYRCAGCMRSFRMLFTGDAGAQTEARMIASGTDLQAAVLKVGHHGSAYSSTSAFIVAVHPRYALISVGRHNSFGHPAPSTVAQLEAAGVTVYRTDRCGAITVDEQGTQVASMIACGRTRSTPPVSNAVRTASRRPQFRVAAAERRKDFALRSTRQCLEVVAFHRTGEEVALSFIAPFSRSQAASCVINPNATHRA
jgi:beta-lactamase superfamily II metal-dependent hydrolase